MVVLFVDLRAVFDTVNREILLKTMRERGVREELEKRCEKVVRETMNTVRIKRRRKVSGEKRVRQRYPLNSLFILLISDINEALRKGR